MPHAGRLFPPFGSTAEFILPVGTLALAALAALAACGPRDRVAHAGARGADPGADRTVPAARAADSAELASGAVPRMVNAEPPFRYPAALYARKVQGNVTLRLHVDSTGHVRPESTSVVASSGYPELDSAAVRGATELTFTPALRDGHPIGRSIRFPVHFRHPDALPSTP